MEPLKIIEREQEILERELLEFETIIESEVINYPNLARVFVKIIRCWNGHVKKIRFVARMLARERYFFKDLESFEEGATEYYGERLIHFFKSKDEQKIREALNILGRKVIEKLRESIEIKRWELCSVDWNSVDARIVNLIIVNKIFSKPLF